MSLQLSLRLARRHGKVLIIYNTCDNQEQADIGRQHYGLSKNHRYEEE